VAFSAGPRGQEGEAIKRSRFSEEQIAYALRLAESGTPVVDVCRQVGVSEATYYSWKKKFGDLGVTELKRLKMLEDERRERSPEAHRGRPDAGQADAFTVGGIRGQEQSLAALGVPSPIWAMRCANRRCTTGPQASSLGSKCAVPGDGLYAANLDRDSNGRRQMSGELTLLYGGAPVIKQVEVQLIFAGSVWTGASAQLATDIHASLTRLLEGPYMWGLSQYGGILPGKVLDHPCFDQDEPVSPVTYDSIGDRVRTLISSGQVADFRGNDQLLYVVLTQGTPFFTYGQGFHDFAYLDSRSFHYAWVIAPSLDEATRNASHEIVEACTDPEIHANIFGYKLKQGTPNGARYLELADPCEDGPVTYSEGVSAAQYWSEIDGACICPTRGYRIQVGPPSDCPIGAVMGQTSILQAVYGFIPDWIAGPPLKPLTQLSYHWGDPPDYHFDYQDSQDKLSTTVSWFSSQAGPYQVDLEFTATSAEGITLYGSLTVTPKAPWQVQYVLVTCRLRHLLASVHRLPPYLINPFGPDGPPRPAATDISQLKDFARRMNALTDQLERASKLANQEKELSAGAEISARAFMSPGKSPNRHLLPAEERANVDARRPGDC
jgi:putative transposase